MTERTKTLIVECAQHCELALWQAADARRQRRAKEAAAWGDLAFRWSRFAFEEAGK